MEKKTTNIVTELSDLSVRSRIEKKQVTGIYPDGKLQVKNKADGFCLERRLSRNDAIVKAVISYLAGIVADPRRLTVLLNKKLPARESIRYDVWRNDDLNPLDKAFPPFYHIEREMLVSIIPVITKKVLLNLGPSTCCAYAQAAKDRDYLVLGNLAERLTPDVGMKALNWFTENITPAEKYWATYPLPIVDYETIEEQIAILNKQKY